MKKLITGILALTMSVACFAGVTACSDKDKAPISSSSEDNTAKLEALESAGEFLKELYKDEVKAVGSDYSLPNSTTYDGTTFKIAWSVEVKTEGKKDSVKVEAGEEETVINVDELTKEEITYVLTATISDEDDNSVTVDFNCKVVVNGSIVAPAENVAYNMYIEQKGALKTLLLTGKMDSQNKFFEMTTDNAKAAKVYAEKATGGYKFYIKGENDEKSYITLTERLDGNYYKADVSFSKTGNIFYYHQAGCWACDLENDTFVIGTHGSYETASASSDHYVTGDNAGSIGVSQFPLLIALPGTVTGGEMESEIELPAADSELTIAQANELASKYASDTYTPYKYYVTATVVEVTNTTYGNMTVTDGTDTLTVYGTYDSTGAKQYGEMTETKPVAGDTVKLYGVLGTYNGTNQMKNGWIKSVTPGSGNQGGGEGGSTVVPETDAATILSKLYALADGETATGDFTLTGKITELDSFKNPTIVVEGFESKPVYCFKLVVENVVGDTITVKATSMKNYQGKYEFMNCTLVSSETGGGSTGGDNTGGEQGGGDTAITTIAGALKATVGSTATFSGTVCEIYQGWSDKYGNMSFYVSDGTDRILVYQASKKVVVGDVVSVSGTIGSFSNVNQIAKGASVTITTAHVCSDFTKADCLNAAVCKVCGTANGSALGHLDENNDKACDRCTAPVGVETTTVTVSIANYASANSWANDKKYSEIQMNDDITVTATGTTNTGKYYTSGTNWRIYQSESPSVVIKAAEGKTIVSVKITYTPNNTGVLTNGETQIASATVVSVNANSITFGVGNTTSSVTKGQVRITAIEVIYA